MNCETIQTNLADYLGEELDSQTVEAFEAHLAVCSSCMHLVKELTVTQDALRNVDEVSLDEARGRTASLVVVRRAGRLRSIVAASMRAAAMILLGIVIGSQFNNFTGDGKLRDQHGETGSVATSKKPPFRPLLNEMRRSINRSNTPTLAHVHPHWIELGKSMGDSQSSFTRTLSTALGGSH